MADAENSKRITDLANHLIDLLNTEARTGHPANALTALQHVVAITLAAYAVPVDVFATRVQRSTDEARQVIAAGGRQ